MCISESIEYVKTDVVTMVSVFVSRISETNNNNHVSIKQQKSFLVVGVQIVYTTPIPMEPQTTVDTPKLPRSMRLWAFIENVLYIAAAIILAVLIQSFVVRPFVVSGNSMDPVIQHAQYILIDQISYRVNEPERGDVVVFRAPPEPTKYYIKRIIGLPGETVQIKNGTVTIINSLHPDGLVLDESYITHTQRDTLSMEVPAGEYFVMGDNRSGSYDSRGWGTLPFDEIRGRAWIRLLPISTIDYLPGKESYE